MSDEASRAAKVPRRGERRLFGEIQTLTLLSSTMIVFAVQLFLLIATSSIMVGDLRRESLATADEIAELLAEPLYNLDSSQVVRVGEALVASGRISGIAISSDLSKVYLEARSSALAPAIPSQERVIAYRGLVVGTVVMDFSDESAVSMRRRLMIVMAFVSLAVALATVVANRFIIMRRIAAPLSTMIQGIDAVGSGRYDLSLEETGFSDIDSVIALINDMALKVKTKNEELRSLNESLEQRVQRRTIELRRSLDELARAQDSLIESSRLAALGHLSAGIAHELNTPLAAIISSAEGLRDYLEEEIRRRPEAELQLNEVEAAFYRQLVGLCAPGIGNLESALSGSRRERAIKKRLQAAGIEEAETAAERICELGLADRLEELLEALQEKGAIRTLETAAWDIGARRMAEIVIVSARKAAGVVSALRSYLNPDTGEQAEAVDLKAELEKVLVLLTNMLKHGIQITLRLDPVRVLGSPDTLAQVWMNLIRNAAQAMDYRGKLELEAHRDGDLVRVRIIDSGHGIPDELKDRIFEPFFSTKQGGEGMGLGLDIARRIVESHGGSIEFESRPGRTVFTVTLPACTS